MSQQAWRRAAILATAAFVIILVISVGGWLDLWDAMGRHRTRSWNWVERSSWFAALAALAVTITGERRSRDRGDAPLPQATTSSAPEPVRTLYTANNQVEADPAGKRLPALNRSETVLDQTKPYNHQTEREELTKALLRDRSEVVLVYGPEGAGKTTLVRWVLKDTGLMAHLRERDLLPGDHFDAKALRDNIVVGTKASYHVRNTEDILATLEAALEVADDTPVVVLVDSAQNLLEPESQRLASLDLDEALALVAAHHFRNVKVVLVFRDPPLVSPRTGWLNRATRIWVNGLSQEDFAGYVETLDPDGDLGLRALARSQPNELHRRLGNGLPGLAQLARTVLELPKKPPSVRELMQLLPTSPEGQEIVLAEKVVDCLRDEQRHVVSALAAFDFPVTEHHVSEVLNERVASGQVTTLLGELTEKHVITAVSGRFYLPNARVADALDQRTDGPASLRVMAAAVLSQERLRAEELRGGIGDLALTFAELRIWLRAGLWLAAYELIKVLDNLLERWDATGLLLDQRLEVSGHLGSDYEEMTNDNAIGYGYASRGATDEALSAFERAKRAAERLEHPNAYRKILLNLGGVYWDCGDTGKAKVAYTEALALAEQQGDAMDRMAALSGLADCHRRHGRYEQATRTGQEALSLASADRKPWAVDLALKVARWYSEEGNRREAERHLERAEKEAARHRLSALRARCRDGRAGLLLDDDRYQRAAEKAREALRQAVDSHDPVTILQARTTLAMASLRLRDVRTARREIDRAGHYRQPGRSLIVLALQALAALADRDDREARAHLTTLRSEAFSRYDKRDPNDFAARDLEALAVTALSVLDRRPLDPATKKFEAARKTALIPPVLQDRIVFLLDMVGTRAQPGALDAVKAAAVGTWPPSEVA